MDRRAAVVPRDLFYPILQAAGDAGFADNIESAERVGKKHPAMQQVVRELKSAQADDAGLFISYD